MQVAEVNTAISIEESANMIAGALSSSTNGLNTLATDVTNCSFKLYKNSVGCGAIISDSISRQSAPGSATTFNFTSKIVSTVNCNTNNQYQSVSSAAAFKGQYYGLKLSSQGNGSANTTVTGLGDAAPAFIVNGQLKNMCGFKMNADTTRKGTISINIGLTNLTIAKSTATVPATITAGTATASVTGNSPKGAFLFEGKLTFNGFNDATLVISKETYTINLATGAVAKR
ncbi:hypothetical protein [Mucilaginibacter antarcticus]